MSAGGNLKKVASERVNHLVMLIQLMNMNVLFCKIICRRRQDRIRTSGTKPTKTNYACSQHESTISSSCSKLGLKIRCFFFQELSDITISFIWRVHIYTHI